jgi:hypothetical protein
MKKLYSLRVNMAIKSLEKINFRKKTEGVLLLDITNWYWGQKLFCHLIWSLYIDSKSHIFTVGAQRIAHVCQNSELGTRSFIRGSLSAPHSIFSHGSLTLMRSFFGFPFSLRARPLVAQPVDRWAKKCWITHRSHEKIGLGIVGFHYFSLFSKLKKHIKQ